MLPQLSLPVSAFKRVVRRLLQVLCVLSIVVSLTACNGSQPPRALLNEALALQIQLTQSAIASSLDLTPMPIAPSVSRVRVEDQESFALGDEQGLRISGRFDWQLPGDRVQVDSPFELFLQRGSRGQSWRLARPKGGSDDRQAWLTYPLGLDKA
ncbi:MAG: hypothetical protein OXU84_09390 [Cyanobacteria bacterium MAG STY4_bin_9]|jgi:hypothetical protein|uniref:hypothetical protein n=1 Tax=Synechococcus sp. RS9902 TaxID=221345 RepID=UPI000B1661D7|nr:hypothetical protein [Synechococcus sp. RS9902]MCH1545138.1 hypothetical protein [Synechococcus sp. MOX_bin32]MCH1604907.1 hypothetical protein [Synechococcus sp. MOX_bin13]MCY3908985.1 hypothetical protein [Cyanobacteria bacterium MAG COS3_bin_20]MCY4083782.1 hypothetical protein [Cyanobacteria bacterium MAG COS1_bin_9]MDD9803934.1 hypothetical protein [Cyanobacteria bacterium MAG STY1_bin_7]MDD9862131.1 hypothetical protein [Cyanobacteria bacterium MAG STY2_bin_7]MDD9882721.1 hypothetic|tara:strand:- start:349 stop:810 length:462 start_codon:yes stop_codon:yes gene_type:complete